MPGIFPLDAHNLEWAVLSGWNELGWVEASLSGAWGGVGTAYWVQAGPHPAVLLTEGLMAAWLQEAGVPHSQNPSELALVVLPGLLIPNAQNGLPVSF